MIKIYPERDQKLHPTCISHVPSLCVDLYQRLHTLNELYNWLTENKTVQYSREEIPIKLIINTIENISVSLHDNYLWTVTNESRIHFLVLPSDTFGQCIIKPHSACILAYLVINHFYSA